MVVTYPLIDKLKFPDNIVTVNQAMIEVATFELFDVEYFNNILYGELG